MSKKLNVQMHKVSSSNILSAGYDEATKTLAVEFSNGNVYHYANVPPDAYAAMTKAESVGTHFIKNIRNSYTFTPIPKAK